MAREGLSLSLAELAFGRASRVLLSTSLCSLVRNTQIPLTVWAFAVLPSPAPVAAQGMSAGRMVGIRNGSAVASSSASSFAFATTAPWKEAREKDRLPIIVAKGAGKAVANTSFGLETGFDVMFFDDQPQTSAPLSVVLEAQDGSSRYRLLLSHRAAQLRFEPAGKPAIPLFA